MKKLFIYAVVLLAGISYSCEENLSSKAPFTEDYALYSVLNVDTTYQTAYIARSYNVDGYDPMENKTDPALEGAVINVRVNNRSDFTFQEATASRNDTSRYKTPFKYYYLNDLHLAGGDSVVITATLRNGKTLKSATKIPFISYLYFETGPVFYDPATNDANHPGIAFAWRFLGGYTINMATNYFAPRLDIVYSTVEEPNKKMRVKVPRYFDENNGSLIPIFPKVFTGTDILFYQESIERILTLISEGDPQKNRYIIHEAEFTLLLMDKNIASYTAAENTFSDEFSIRIDAADFSNIQNGIGLFGGYASKKVKVKIAQWFIRSLGYRTSY